MLNNISLKRILSVLAFISLPALIACDPTILPPGGSELSSVAGLVATNTAASSAKQDCSSPEAMHGNFAAVVQGRPENTLTDMGCGVKSLYVSMGDIDRNGLTDYAVSYPDLGAIFMIYPNNDGTVDEFRIPPGHYLLNPTQRFGAGTSLVNLGAAIGSDAQPNGSTASALVIASPDDRWTANEGQIEAGVLPGEHHGTIVLYQFRSDRSIWFGQMLWHTMHHDREDPDVLCKLAASNVPGQSIIIPEYMGRTIENAGDLNGDSMNDLLVTDGQGQKYVLIVGDAGRTVGCYKGEPKQNLLKSFTAGFPWLEKAGLLYSSTSLKVTWSQKFPPNVNYTYEILSGAGYISGPDTAEGKRFNAGDTGGDTRIRVTAKDNTGFIRTKEMTITVLDKVQQIGHKQGGFSGNLENFSQFGSSVASIGDLDGDGVVDLAVGNHLDAAGALWILLLNSDRTVKSNHKVMGLNDSEQFGRSVVNLGDLDGDGVNDLAVGAPAQNTVRLLFMNKDGSVKSRSSFSAATPLLKDALDQWDYFGQSLANLGDLNGDGINELAVGVPYDDDENRDTGAVYILYLTQGGGLSHYKKISAVSGNFQGGLQMSAAFGVSLANIGDLNGDGVTDLAVGAMEAVDGPGNGALHILFLNGDGSVKSSQKIDEGQGNAQFGYSVTAMGDVDRDGVLDIAVGAPMDSDNCYNCGSVFMLFLNTDGTLKNKQKIGYNSGSLPYIGLSSSARFGGSLANLGNLSEPGFNHLVVGANLYDGGYNIDDGAIWSLWLQADGTVKH